MEYCGYIGNVVMEALKNFKGPVPINSITSKVAVQMGCQEKDIVNVVTETINGGVRFGFIQRRRERYAFVPFHFVGLLEEDSLEDIFVPQKSKTLNNVEKKPPIIDESIIQTLYRSPKFNISIPQFNYKASKQNLSFRTFKPYADSKKKETISIHSSPVLKEKYSQAWDVCGSRKRIPTASVKMTSKRDVRNL